MSRRATKRVVVSGLILALAAGLLLFYWDTLVNTMARRFVLTEVSRRLGGKTSVETISVHLFPPLVEIIDLSVDIDKGPLKQFSVKKISIEPGVGPIFTGKIYVKNVVVEDPFFRIDLTQSAVPAKQKKTKKFKIPSASDLIELKVDGLEVKGARLALELPGSDLQVQISRGHASYQSGGSNEEWTWKGFGEVYRGKRKIAFDDVSVVVERQADHIHIKHFHIMGLGVDGTMKGDLFPKLDLQMDMFSDIPDTLKALDDLDLFSLQQDVEGTARCHLNLKGTFDAWSATGEMNAQSLSLMDRDIDSIKSKISFNSKELQSLDLTVQSEGATMKLEVNDISKNSSGNFRFLARDVPFESIEKWIDPEVENYSLLGPVSVESEGRLGLWPLSLFGNFQIAAPKLSLNFDEDVNRFLPIHFDEVRIHGELGWSKERNFFVDAGELLANGLEGKFKFDFPKNTFPSGLWVGNLLDVGEIFDKSMPVKGAGQIGGGLKVDDQGFEALISLNIENFQYSQRAKHDLVGDILFKKKHTFLKNFSVESVQGNASLKFDADFDQKNKKELLKARFSEFDLGWIADIASIAYPIASDVEGVGSGQVLLGDFSTKMNGQIELTSNKAQWRGLLFDSVEADVAFENGTAVFNRAEIIKEKDYRAALTGKMGLTSYDHLQLAFSGLPLSFLETPEFIRQFVSIADGRVSFHGPLDNPMVEGSFQLFHENELGEKSWAGIASMNGPLDRVNGSVSLNKDSFEAIGWLDFKNLADFKTKGHFNHFSLNPVFQGVPSTIAAEWDFSGHLKSFKNWNGQMTFHSIQFGQEERAIQLSRPTQVNVKQGQIQPTKMVFEGKETQLESLISIDASENLAVSMKGSIPLGILSLFRTGISRAEGNLQVQLDFGGPFDDLKAAGRYSSQGALIQFKEFPHDLENATLRGTIDQKSMYVDEMQAIVGGGNVKASGRLDFGSNEDSKISLVGYADHVSMRFPDWLPMTASGSMSLVGSLIQPTLKGDFTIHRARYQDEWDWKSQILTFGSSARNSRILKTKEENIYFDLHFTSEGDQILLKNDIAEGKLRGDVRLVGSDKQIGLLGKVEVVEGTVEFLDNLFELTSGVVTFDKKDEVDPLVDLTAKTRVAQVDIFLDIRTEDDEIKAFLSSQPVRDETNIIALLTIGVDTDQLLVTQQNSNVSSSVLPGVLSAPVQSKLQKGLRETKVLDTLQFVPFFSDQTQSTGLKMLVGKELFPKVKLLYSTDLFNVGAENTIRLEQSFNDNVSLQGSVRDNRQDQNEEIDFGVDFEFKFDF
ncbi:MAG: translocation/assembly module TamB domain-containing protein [Bdellovibrionales bacterium]|nr:translocation/assembly module TamB domain-containing protein [Bdellovibrionales bacterium]